MRHLSKTAVSKVLTYNKRQHTTITFLHSVNSKLIRVIKMHFNSFYEFFNSIVPLWLKGNKVTKSEI
jgi:hypothetical protein